MNAAQKQLNVYHGCIQAWIGAQSYVPSLCCFTQFVGQLLHDYEDDVPL